YEELKRNTPEFDETDDPYKKVEEMISTRKAKGGRRAAKKDKQETKDDTSPQSATAEAAR
ncbi:MAG: hypothetical protein AAFX85_11290, partial [Pseudomonadota bacterium]